MKKLTTRQREVLDYISDYICDRGYPPTIREIGDQLGIKSTNGVSEHLETLWRKGYLIRDEERSNLARAMRPRHLPTVPLGAYQIPLIGEVTAGAPRLALEEPEEHLHFDRSLVGDHRDVFALRIDGSSMIERGIQHGDLVFVRRTNEAKDGDVVIALIDDEATCKTFYREGRKIRLQPENSTMEPIYVSRNMFKETMILGVVIGVYHTI
jgi:repressor LexA